MIKEYCPKAKTVIIRLGSYDKRASTVAVMVGEMCDDIGAGNLEEPRVVLYAGDYYAKTMGVEAKLKCNPLKVDLSEYREVRELELYYG